MKAGIGSTATLALAASCAALIVAPTAGATTYNNDTPIIIPSQGIATPYASSITVSGTAGPITDVNVGLDGLSHTNPEDVAIALVAPGGQALKIQNCVGGDTDAAGVFLTFDDSSLIQLPDAGAISSATYKPTSRCGAGDSFPAPGPGLSYEVSGPIGAASLASIFNGTSAIGTWSLYVIDTEAGFSGSIPGGWSLDVNPNVTPPPAPTPPPGITCGTGTVLSGSQCVVQKKKKKKRKRRKK